MKNINQNELLYMCHLNDPYAYKMICQKYEALIHKEVNSIVRQYPGLYDKKEDLFQESLFSLTQAIDTYRKDQYASFTTFISLIIRRRLLNESRKITAASSIPLYEQFSIDSLDENGHVREIASKGGIDDPTYHLILQESYSQIQKSIANFNVMEKKVFYSWLNGDSYKEGTKRCACANTKKYEAHLRKIKKIVHEAIA